MNFRQAETLDPRYAVSPLRSVRMAKSGAKWSDALTLSAVAAGVLWPVVAEFSWGIPPGVSWQRLAILCAGPIVALAVAWSKLRNRRRQNSAAERFLAALELRRPP